MRLATWVAAAMKTLGLALAVAVALPAPVRAQGKSELNRVTRVQIRGDSVEIAATRPPSFTTFSLTNPPRLVIDVAEAAFAGIPATIAGGGAITGIKTVSYGSGSAAIARLVIGLQRELETDIETNGNGLVVRVLGASGGPAVASGGPERKEQEKAEAEATRRAQEERAAQEKAAREASERAEAERRSRADAQKAAKEEAARQAEAQRKAEAEAARRAEEERAQREKAERERVQRETAERRRAEREQSEREKAEREKAEREKAEQEKVAREKAERERVEQAKRDAEARRQAAEAARREAQQRVEAEKAAREEAARRAREDREAQQKAEREAREERIAQQKAEREAAEAARREAEERRKRDQEARAEAARKAAATHASQGKQGGEVARSGGKESVGSAGGSGRRTVSLVGFHPQPEGHGSRVVIRTDAPAQFEIREADETTIVVALPNTRIGSRNNARFLDTSFFDTPVQRVSPTEVGRDVHVEIKLKAAAPYQARQDGPDLVVEFRGQ